ncbi:vicilin Cor a 11.0101-like [Impatiens glandulifera]|uniref:vicilin Cor a 11.0101-like n=1 Tax=Impatiens glandulifera TaxID=253017 RepID=UPI001FB108D9|nr:vicilin Cor a 11.0101-like [Impatiens glandulifera]
MTAKSRIIFPFLFLVVFLLLATDHLVHGNDAYDQCVSDCKKWRDPDVRWPCIQHCQGLKNGIEQGSYKDNKFEKEHGRLIGLLQDFTENSKLLTGLVNHGVAILEANPNTFMAPGHWDADALFFVVQGKATINLIRHDKRETLGLKTGDNIRIPSGTKVLMMNRDRMEKLVVIKLPQPVSTPAAGHSEVKLLNPFGDQSSQQQQLAEGIRSVI